MPDLRITVGVHSPKYITFIRHLAAHISNQMWRIIILEKTESMHVKKINKYTQINRNQKFTAK